MRCLIGGSWMDNDKGEMSASGSGVKKMKHWQNAAAKLTPPHTAFNATSTITIECFHLIRYTRIDLNSKHVPGLTEHWANDCIVQRETILNAPGSSQIISTILGGPADPMANTGFEIELLRVRLRRGASRAWASGHQLTGWTRTRDTNANSPSAQ